MCKYRRFGRIHSINRLELKCGILLFLRNYPYLNNIQNMRMIAHYYA